MKSEIIKKLKFIEKSHQFSEKDVIYFVVEARKIIEREGSVYPILKFYADWAVHTKKERITKEIYKIAEQISRSNPLEGGGASSDFMNMTHLRDEIVRFLDEHKINSKTIVDNWRSFSNSLGNILINQPIIFPKNPGIESISFVNTSNEKIASLEIKFISGRMLSIIQSQNLDLF